VYSLVRAELHTARELGEELMRLAESAPTPAFHLKRAHNVLGITLFWLSEFVSARTHFEHGLALDAPQQRSAIDFSYGQDAEVVSLAYLSCLLWFLGYPDQALYKSQEALAAARAGASAWFSARASFRSLGASALARYTVRGLSQACGARQSKGLPTGQPRQPCGAGH
jgi:tetratricopeptide (TPR) repeat protein